MALVWRVEYDRGEACCVAIKFMTLSGGVCRGMRHQSASPALPWPWAVLQSSMCAVAHAHADYLLKYATTSRYGVVANHRAFLRPCDEAAESIVAREAEWN
jgi:hypothetical protein